MKKGTQQHPDEVLAELGFEEYFPVSLEDSDVHSFRLQATQIGGRNKVIAKAWYSQDEGAWGVQLGNNRTIANGSWSELPKFYTTLRNTVRGGAQ